MGRKLSIIILTSVWNIVLGILGLLIYLVPIILFLFVVGMSIWMVRHFLPFSLFESTLVSIGMWCLILLTYISLKLTDIQMNIDYPDMENDDYDEDEDHDDLLDEKIKVIKQMK